MSVILVWQLFYYTRPASSCDSCFSIIQGQGQLSAVTVILGSYNQRRQLYIPLTSISKATGKHNKIIIITFIIGKDLSQESRIVVISEHDSCKTDLNYSYQEEEEVEKKTCHRPLAAHWRVIKNIGNCLLNQSLKILTS